MTLRVARAALFAMVPAELLLAVLLVSGVPLPHPVIVAAEVAVAAVLVLEAVAAYRLFREARRAGAGRRASWRTAYERLVPVQVRRIMGFDWKGLTSLALWAARRRDGVPPGATAHSYSGAQTSTMLMFLFAMVVELVGLEIILRAIDAPAGLRAVVFVIDAYSILIVLAIVAACITRPHVVTEDEIRLRYGAFFDLRVPRHLIADVRRVRNYDEKGMVRVTDDHLAIAVASQTNVVIELTEPVTATRPLGRRVKVSTIRFYTDDPSAALTALRRTRSPVPE
ncbi:hypothetical protein [Thermomonospora umbrina]|uniref:Uncharacterized protein n=1 Tax=Thermomonospora umbrina TaxID=111806 RepID=A0A3D9SPG0_9ACTN|nr:hypothetical protein [Thermomonospora umbrina]REE97852.1 hypothetical protein DFJ69_3327 [Thermomonospora umbrina]